MTPAGEVVRGFGLTLASAVPVRGAVPATGTPDIAIARGVAPTWEATLFDEPYRAASTDLFDFTMPGVARYACIGRDRILIDALPGAVVGDVTDMLIATALPALLWARGGIVLHAAAALFPGARAAIAIAGDSGTGKSTWLARAVALGARIVADDALHVRVDGEDIIASGLPGGYFERTGPGPDDRRFRAVPHEAQADEARLGAILVLEPGTGTPHLLSGTAAVAALLRHRHRPRIARLLGLEAAALARIAALARLPIVAVSPGTSR